jgi:2-oxoglutarate dehydrogenase E2 component (dihydrolipoamide succinyltransferase)
METEVRVPSVGESITEGQLTAWLKQNGDRVAEGEDLFELETEKATMAVPSPGVGVLEILVPAGSEVKINQQVGWLHAQATAGATARAAPAPTPPPVPAPVLSPAVRRIVDQHGLDPKAIAGTGRDGRILKADALRAVQEAPAAQAPSPPPATLAGPVVAALPPPPPSATVPAEPTPQASDQRRVPMSMLRRKTAERLVAARQAAAHLTTFNEIDMQAVSAIRSRYKQEFEERNGVRLGLMSFFVKACCRALRAYPAVNAMVEGGDMVYNNRYHIGVAVSLEQGLVVPVVRDADRLTFAGIEARIAQLAQAAKEKKLSPGDLTGGTFSITNGGVFGSLLSTPIPAFPQTGILGMHAIQKRPVVVDDQIVIRPMMYVALTYDHRAIDGREAIGFLVMVKALLEQPERLLLAT